MASSAKCLLKWLYVAADVGPNTLHVGAWTIPTKNILHNFTGKPWPQKDWCSFLVKVRWDESYVLESSFLCEMPWRLKFLAWQVKDSTYYHEGVKTGLGIESCCCRAAESGRASCHNDESSSKSLLKQLLISVKTHLLLCLFACLVKSNHPSWTRMIFSFCYCSSGTVE